MEAMNINGPKMDPWWTPLVTLSQTQREDPIGARCLRGPLDSLGGNWLSCPKVTKEFGLFCNYLCCALSNDPDRLEKRRECVKQFLGLVYQQLLRQIFMQKFFRQ